LPNKRKNITYTNISFKGTPNKDIDKAKFPSTMANKYQARIVAKANKINLHEKP
jgi:hypothetical protein